MVKKFDKTKHPSPLLFAARANSCPICHRLYVVGIHHCLALGLATYRALVVFGTLLGFGYSRHCSDWSRAPTQMSAETLIDTNQPCSARVQPSSFIRLSSAWGESRAAIHTAIPKTMSASFLKERQRYKAVSILEITLCQRSFWPCGFVCKHAFITLVPVYFCNVTFILNIVLYHISSLMSELLFQGRLSSYLCLYIFFLFCFMGYGGEGIPVTDMCVVAA